MRQLRILLAEDVQMVRGALVALLELEDDLTIVADIGRGDEILPTALHHNPDVAVIDIDLPGLDGLTAVTQLQQRLPTCRTLILTSLGRPGTLRRALNARVTGFMLKDSPPAQLAESVRRVATGQRTIDPELALAAWDAGECPLSDRELSVLQLAATGAEPHEISDMLCLSLGTVRNYLTTSVTKLNARNRIDAIRIAHDTGWII
ncbi:DNA-binding response regulator [Streptomyces sp. NPDC020983]|uniref:DNA-binding response regulator n=1 Tax=Streptomyces sp. NPDC020983 TaxID=3365106 RepID=UPI0037904112